MYAPSTIRKVAVYGPCIPVGSAVKLPEQGKNIA